MVELDNVVKSFPRAGRLLDGVSLHVDKGMRWGLVGPGASGKTVLLKLIAGLLPPDEGKIVVAGRDMTEASEDELQEVRIRIGMLFQNYALFDFMTVAENVAFPLVRRGGLGRQEIDERVADRLKSVGLLGSEHKRPSELSGGMKRRVGIARATITQPEIIIYDEPTAGLDPVTTSKVYDLLRADHEETHGTVLAVSSDVAALRGFVSRIAFLYRGKLHYDGPADGIEEAEDPVVRQFVRGELEGPL